ncbi:hypothetical protein [Micromonospora radicis]|uniref:Uncharacterized protein n=1 Tax=Micromonospora radicis TaxID=1894971 RepID=A0A418MS01_9ACTN|nr:hypothetical protein [Micromonospora radicis]RIV36923.1 hypothetical protein D2L64_18220 [Micromonospora radicis]
MENSSRPASARGAGRPGPDEPATGAARPDRPAGAPGDRPGADDPNAGRRRSHRPAGAQGGPADHRRRVGQRRHRAGIGPPAALGLPGPESDSESSGRRPRGRRAGLADRLLDPTGTDPTEDDDLAGTGTGTDENRRGSGRRRRLTLAGLASTAVVSAVMLVVTLVTWAPDGPAARDLTDTERDRLAAMRVTNYRDLRAGLHVTVGADAARADLLGWVDWARQLVYLDVGGPGAGALRGLLQATPSVLLVRPDPTAVPAPAMPPLIPPTDGWRLPADRRLDPLLAMLFALGADRTDPADGLSGRWVGHDQRGGESVDILEATPPGATAVPAEATRYWLDPGGRLHRLETTLPALGPVTVQLSRADRPTLRPVDALGGRPGLPRALNADERERWRRLPARLRTAGGATVTLAAPVSGGTNLHGTGWLSWTSGIAYLAVTDVAGDGTRTLLRRERDRSTRIDTPAADDAGSPPPLPPPATGWRTGGHRTEALDPLLAAALGAARGSVPAGEPRRLRGDNLAGKAVDVVEVETGGGPARYWVDRSGLLRRLELPTRGGAWAQLDLSPGRIPRLKPR